MMITRESLGELKSDEVLTNAGGWPCAEELRRVSHVGCWPVADEAVGRREVRLAGKSRPIVLRVSSSRFDPERKLPPSDWLIILGLAGVQGWIISSTSHWLIGADVAGAVGIVSASATLTYAEKSGECVPRG
jgi:hypothetical protein